MKTDIKAPLNTVEAFINHTLVYSSVPTLFPDSWCLTVSTSFLRVTLGVYRSARTGITGILFGFKHLNSRGDSNLRAGRMTLSVVLALSLEIFYWLVLVSRDTEVTNWSAAAPSQILKKQNEPCFSLRLSCGAEVEGFLGRL